MIDRYTKDRFEAVLPVLKGTKQILWAPLGIIGGEQCYLVPVKPGVVIYVRSTVGPDGRAAESCEDSIRVWLASGPDGKPLGSKFERWISRVNRWDERLKKTLRILWQVGMQLKMCPNCRTQMMAFKTASGANKGRWYMKCDRCTHWDCWLKMPAKVSAKAAAKAGSDAEAKEVTAS